ncbi:CHAT domain-containing protein [Streptomyces sp. TS71-3]|uniref:CHAT domain-containing protein n=1 Tax=Streptomyces sp. TS71-3 TaxID=2733862 RepID=UPI001B0CE39B|nr:CHAT domain-containing protein [Streptomyces sp. TS71-3]GHJ42007.1 hypothetical protein Sm713_76160 [Streptomyces sp. TS71-3]
MNGHLTTLVVSAQEKDSKYSYQLLANDGSGSGPLVTEYDTTVDLSLINDWCTKIDTALRDKPADGAQAPLAILEKTGERLYNHLFPLVRLNVPDLITGLRGATGPVVIQTNEPAQTVPWELLHDGTDFLGLKYDLGRRAVGRRQVISGRGFDRIRRALVVGDPCSDLPAAREEARLVTSWLSARDVECTTFLGDQATKPTVVEELEGPYDLFHFSGHVVNSGGVVGLMMHRREVLGEPALNTLSAQGVPPVVFLNGCASAGQVESMCRTFMVLGAKSVIGTRTNVTDDGAWRFAEEFYERLLDGEPAGAAVRGARASLRDRPDNAWASFMLFGDPRVCLTDEGTSGDAPTEPVVELPDVLEGLTPDASALIRRAARYAVGRSSVTSLELLQALLDEEEIRDRVEDGIGEQRLTMVTKLIIPIVRGRGLTAVLGLLDGDEVAEPDDGRARRAAGAEGDGGAGGTADGATPPTEVERSGTVERVLYEAETLANAQGRAAVTVADIATAFVELGGGSAGSLLEQLGIPAEHLLPGGRRPDPGPFRQADNGNGKLRTEGLSRGVAGALRLARVIANARGESIGTHTLFLALGAMGSETLHRALAEQGEQGEKAFDQLSGLFVPRRQEFSARARAALEKVHRDAAGTVGEAGILRELLADEKSGARSVLKRFGVDAERLSQDLGPAD